MYGPPEEASFDRGREPEAAYRSRGTGGMAAMPSLRTAITRSRWSTTAPVSRSGAHR